MEGTNRKVGVSLTKQLGNGFQFLESLSICISPCCETIRMTSVNDCSCCARTCELNILDKGKAICIYYKRTFIFELLAKITGPWPLLR